MVSTAQTAASRCWNSYRTSIWTAQPSRLRQRPHTVRGACTIIVMGSRAGRKPASGRWAVRVEHVDAVDSSARLQHAFKLLEQPATRPNPRAGDQQTLEPGCQGGGHHA